MTYRAADRCRGVSPLFFLFVNANCVAHARSVYLCFGGRLAIVSTALTTASSQTHGTGPTCKIDGQADASDTMQAAGGLTHVVAALASRMDADCMELCVLLWGHGVRCGSDKGPWRPGRLQAARASWTVVSHPGRLPAACERDVSFSLLSLPGSILRQHLRDWQANWRCAASPGAPKT